MTETTEQRRARVTEEFKAKMARAVARMHTSPAVRADAEAAAKRIEANLKSKAQG